jgi:hypothetical protein
MGVKSWCCLPCEGVSACLFWWIPEGVCHKALRAGVEVVDGNLSDLLWDLVLHRHAMQWVVDALWDLDEVPNKSQYYINYFTAF